jgi:NAD(P)-dependent dehydrogenase (short-subunit alcohol dehydrogenase family)
MDKKVAIITGGAQGIGKAITKKCLENNMIACMLDIDNEAGNETLAEHKQYGSVEFIKTDVSVEDDVKRAVQAIVSKYNRIDCLINNAAILNNKPISQLSIDEWNRVIGVNLSGAFICSKYCEPYLKQTKGGIVNIASTRAFMSEPNTEAYSASKGAIVALTHALAISLGPDIRVNCISPGWIEVSDYKKGSKNIVPVHTEEDKSQHPCGRVGVPDDIANMVLYLLSDKASFITGQNFTIDGGMTKKMIYI